MNEVLSLSLEDFINAPSKAESVLDLLSPEQLLAIEQTLGQVKKRKLDKTTVKKKSIIKPPNTSIPSEPMTELKDGIEWVSFIYSHNRTLKRYSIRTDLQHVDMSLIDNKFKSENCIYPRANLPKEEYHGNRWTYETECNELGWRLAWLNKDEISGKRGLIQRAVDSYRNRYPSMRSRRVARQEKLLNGTLRKRKYRETDSVTENTILPSGHHPKTIAIEDVNNQRFRIKINIESVDLEEINMEFRKANCPFPRVMNMVKPAANSARWIEETICNELAWKLAWLNPRHLAGKKNMLQRALDIYRSKFAPLLQPRKSSKRLSPTPPPASTPSTAGILTQNALHNNAASPAMSNISGTIESLDFTDCFSLSDKDTEDKPSAVAANAAAVAAFCDLLLQEANMLQDTNSYCSNSTAATPSPPTGTIDIDFFDHFIVNSNNDPFFNVRSR